MLNILRVLVLPTKLGDDGLGQVTLAISFTTFFGIFTSLGASTYLVRAIAQDPPAAHRYLSNAFALRVVMAGLVLALQMGIANLFGYSTETMKVIFVVAIFSSLAAYRGSLKKPSREARRLKESLRACRRSWSGPHWC